VPRSTEIQFFSMVAQRNVAFAAVFGFTAAVVVILGTAASPVQSLHVSSFAPVTTSAALQVPRVAVGPSRIPAGPSFARAASNVQGDVPSPAPGVGAFGAVALGSALVAVLAAVTPLLRRSFAYPGATDGSQDLTVPLAHPTWNQLSIFGEIQAQHDARAMRTVLHAAAKGKGKGGGKGKIAGIIKLALPAGKATPAPPVGPALGQYGLNIVQFCKEYNAATEKEAGDGMIIPVEITAMDDRSYTFVLKTPPASVLLRKAANVPKGSATPNKDIVGSITIAQLEEIARKKLPDLNTADVQKAMTIVKGTAKNMGIAVK
jgi:large subunit ribosomal protein L11